MSQKEVSSFLRKPPTVCANTYLPVVVIFASALLLCGCASVQVHLGVKVDLSKIPVTSIEVQQAKAPGIGPGQKSSMIVTITQPSGKTLQTEGAGHGKVMWRDLTVTPTVIAVNKKAVISLRHDPRPTEGKLPHVAVTVPSHSDLHADLDIPLRYDFAFVSNFSGSAGASGTKGTDRQDGTSGSPGSIDPNNPSSGGDGGNGTDGSNGQDGDRGGDAPPVQIQMTVARGSHLLLQFGVFTAGHKRYYLVDPSGGSLSVLADGGSGGSGGR